MFLWMNLSIFFALQTHVYIETLATEAKTFQFGFFNKYLKITDVFPFGEKHLSIFRINSCIWLYIATEPETFQFGFFN